jgi:hypothetical protein
MRMGTAGGWLDWLRHLPLTLNLTLPRILRIGTLEWTGYWHRANSFPL